MALFDLVRPQWKHSDPAKRAEAMRFLEEDRQDVFLPAVLEDADAEVRLAAARRVTGEANMRKALDKTADGAVREVLHKALVKLTLERARTARNPTEAEADAWVNDLRGWAGGEKALEDLSLNAAALAVRKAALAGITHAGSFLAVALKEEDPSLAIEAFSRLTRAAQFETVAKGAKCREVRQAAKDRLRSQEEAKKPDEAALNRAKLHLLVSVVEKAEAGSADPGHGFDWEAAVEQVDEAVRALDGLLATGLPVAEGLRAQFDNGVTVFRSRHAVHAAGEAARRERDAEEARVREIREGICARLEGLYADPKSDDGAYKELEELTRAFQTAAPSHGETAEGEPLRERFRIARERLRDKLRKQREQDDAQRREEQTAQQATHKAAQDAREAEESARRERERPLAAATLEKVITELETLAGTSDLKLAEKRLRELQSQGKSLLSILGDSSQGATLRYHAAADHLRETLDWSRWSNLQRKQALCDQLEKLQQIVGEPAADTTGTVPVAVTAANAEEKRRLFGRFKELLAEWKSVGPVTWDATEATWDRYHAAADALYEKFREHFAELDEEREANFKTKEELCAKLEGLMASPDVEWRDVNEAFREAHAAWKAIGAVPREKSDALWERFKAVNKAFHDKRDGSLNENLAAKRALITRVEELKDSTDWKAAAAAIKEAQEQWKTIGPVPRDKSEGAWNRFHGACEAFFAARRAHFDALDAERPLNMEKKVALCERVESLGDLASDRERYEAILDAQAQWKEIGPVPREHEDALWDRFRAPLDAYFAAHRERSAAERALRDQGAKEKEALCAEAESLKDSTEWKATIEAIKGLQARWKASPPAPRHLDQALWQRFRGACDAFFDRLKANGAARDGDREGNLRLKEDLCFAVEIMSGLPAADADARMARDAWVEAQLAAGHGAPTAPEGPSDWNRATEKVKSLQQEWRAIGPVPREDNDTVWNRFQRACDAFFDERRRAVGGSGGEHGGERGRGREGGEDPQHNLEEKLALIADAEELAHTPGIRNLPIAQDLQRKWKRIGPVPRAQTEYVNERFAAACTAAVSQE
jgi:hypothetical protein